MLQQWEEAGALREQWLRKEGRAEALEAKITALSAEAVSMLDAAEGLRGQVKEGREAVNKLRETAARSGGKARVDLAHTIADEERKLAGLEAEAARQEAEAERMQEEAAAQIVELEATREEAIALQVSAARSELEAAEAELHGIGEEVSEEEQAEIRQESEAAQRQLRIAEGTRAAASALRRIEDALLRLERSGLEVEDFGSSRVYIRRMAKRDADLAAAIATLRDAGQQLREAGVLTESIIRLWAQHPNINWAESAIESAAGL